MNGELTVHLAVLDGNGRQAQSRSVSDGLETLERLRQALRPRYDVLGVIGRGGMAAVYLARDLKLERRVAVKLLPPDVAANAETRDRFLREARTAANLSHPNIVPIHDANQVDDLLYFTMDYVEGRTLAQRIADDGPLTVGDATRVIHDAARAIGFAHKKGIVHRDVKPDNIMIEKGTDRVMVMDFGIGGLYSEPLTDRPYVVFGQPKFMSPEVVQGALGDERADVYALGVTAYCAVTGQLPFDGETVEEILRQQVSLVAPKLHVQGKNLDVTYARAVERCLAKNPSERFAGANELAEELATAPELRHEELPVALRAYVDRLNQYSLVGRGLAAVIALGLFAVVNGAVHGDWRLSGLATGGIVITATLFGAAALRVTRRLFDAGPTRAHLTYTRADLIHALSVEAQREWELHLYVDGEAARTPGRLGRRIGYSGLGLMVLAMLSSLVEAIDPVIAAYGMGIGFVTWLGGSLFGHWKLRKRGDLPRNLWLEFWRSRAGGLAARLAALGLESQPVLEENATNQVRAMTALAASRIERIRARLMLATDTQELRARLEQRSLELEGLRSQLLQVQSPQNNGRMTPVFEKVRRVCDMVDGLLQVNELGQEG